MIKYLTKFIDNYLKLTHWLAALTSFPFILPLKPVFFLAWPPEPLAALALAPHAEIAPTER